MKTVNRRGIIGAMAASAMIAGASPVSAKTEIGKPAPKFTLHTFDRKTVKLSDLSGSVVLLNYWATWCGPCRHELPQIDAWVRAYRQKTQRDDLKVFAISTEDSVPDEALRPLAKVLSFPLVSWIDSSGYGPIDQAVPSNYIIDRTGVLRYAKANALDVNALNALLPPLLNDPGTDQTGFPVTSPGAA